MGRRRKEKQHDKFTPKPGLAHHHVPDPLVRLVAAHPTRPLIVFAVGTSVRVLDRSGDGSSCGASSALPALTTDGLSGHAADVRVVAFSPDGNLLMTACDDRIVRLWDVPSWKCVLSW